MATLEHQGPLFVDLRGTDFRGSVLISFFGPAAIAELQRRGVPFVVRGPNWVRQFGPSRRFNGTNARAVLSFRFGEQARVAPPGARRVALHDGPTGRGRREFLALRERIKVYIRDNRLRGGACSVERFEPGAVLESGSLNAMLQAGCLPRDDAWSSRFDRYNYLWERRQNETVALFVKPLG